MNIKQAAEKLGFDVKGNLTNCFNKSGHKNGDQKPSLFLYENSYRCLACGITGNKAELVKQILNVDYPEAMQWLGEDNTSIITKPKNYKKPEINPEPINNKIIEYLSKRGIKEETVKRFNVGYLDNAILFQYHKNNELVGVKYRSLTEKKFWKEKDCMPTLFGQDLIRSDTLVIAEGEIDCMSLWEYNIESVSIPSGVSDLTWIENDWEFLQRFGKIYIMMDNDQAGQSAVEKLVDRLGKWRCYNVKLPYKDANECLMKGLLAEDFDIIFEEAESYDLEELKSPKEFKSRVHERLTNPDKLNGIKTSSDEFTQILKGWRKKEVTIWSGYNGSGKSTFISQEILGLLKNGERVAIGSFEMPPENYLIWMGSQYYDNDMSPEHIDEFFNKLHEKLFIIDVVGEIDKDRLFDIMEFGYKKYGIENFVIDSLMKVSLTTNSQKLYGEQKVFVSKLKDFSMDYNSHVHLVAHSRKGTNDDSVMGKMDVAGSGDITNLADNVIVVHRHPESNVVDTSIFIKKNRAFGSLGEVRYVYKPNSKSFKVANPEDRHMEDIFNN